MSASEAAWFAIRVKYQFEKIVSGALRYKGYEELLPLYRASRRWSDRTKIIQLPLFPGYLFGCFDPAKRMSILGIPGVLLIVSRCRIPVPIDIVEIERIRLVVASGQSAKPWPRLEKGQTVRIECGPLRGMEGTLLRFKGSRHLIVGVNLLQRSIAVEVEEDWILPSNPAVSAANSLAFPRKMPINPLAQNQNR